MKSVRDKVDNPQRLSDIASLIGDRVKTQVWDKFRDQPRQQLRVQILVPIRIKLDSKS